MIRLQAIKGPSRGVQDSRLIKAASKSNRVHTIDWSLIGGLSPHKIFLWDQEGQYLDCEFPSPVYGHFLGGAKLRGAMIHDVFSQAECKLLLMAIRQAFDSHAPTMVCIDMAKAGVVYRSVIRFLPMQEVVIGWVNDFPIKAHGGDSRRRNHLKSRTMMTLLTAREWEIATFVAQCKSNEEIARLLCISLRTVKFHLSHVLEKLQVTSRTQVQALLPLLQQV